MYQPGNQSSFCLAALASTLWLSQHLITNLLMQLFFRVLSSGDRIVLWECALYSFSSEDEAAFWYVLDMSNDAGCVPEWDIITPSRAQGTLWKETEGMLEPEDGKMSSKKISSLHGVALALVTSLWLWIFSQFAQDLHECAFNISPGMNRKRAPEVVPSLKDCWRQQLLGKGYWHPQRCSH